MEESINKFTNYKQRKPSRKTFKPSRITGNNGKNIYPLARLTRRNLYSILSTLVNLDSMKSRACITLAMLSVTSLWTNRQGVDVNCQKKPIRGFTRSWYTGIRFLKQCLQALLTSRISLPDPTRRPPTRFFNPPESLEQATIFKNKKVGENFIS